MRVKFRYLLPLLALAVSSHAADFETLAGSSMPSIRSRELRSYFVDTVIPARVAECEDVTRSSDLYCDPASADDSGTGTTSALSGANRAKKTISGLNTAIAASSGNVNVYLKRDTRYSTDTGLVISNKNGVKVTTYGTGAKPVIHCFRNSFSSGGSWTQSGEAYYASVASAVGWVRVGTNFETRMNPLSYRTSVANVQADADDRGWYWDDATDRLYVNIGAASPGSTVVEYSLLDEIDQQGISIEGTSDQTLIENIVIEGFGAGPGGTGNACYGIKSSATGRLLVRDCEAYHCGSHAMGANNGGIQTWQRCKGGLCFKSDHNTSTFVYFSANFNNANDECIFQECEAVAGFLPDATNEPRTWSNQHTGFYAHENSDDGTITTYDLLVVLDCKEPAQTWRSNWTATWGGVWFSNSPGSDSVESTYRTLVIGHREQRSVPTRWACAPRTAYIGCLYDCIWPTTDNSTQLYDTTSTNFGGRQFRNIFKVLDLRTTATTRYVWPNGTIILDGCTFHLDGVDAANSYVFNAAESTSTTFVATNCLLIRAGEKPFANGGGNNTSRWPNLAMWRPRSGTNDTYDWNPATLSMVTLDRPLGAFDSPKDTQIETGALTSGPDYDFYWRACPEATRSFGAIEANPDTPTTLDEVGTNIQSIITSGVKLKRVDP